jgi:hypothetical protein
MCEVDFRNNDPMVQCGSASIIAASSTVVQSWISFSSYPQTADIRVQQFRAHLFFTDAHPCSTEVTVGDIPGGIRGAFA